MLRQRVVIADPLRRALDGPRGGLARVFFAVVVAGILSAVLSGSLGPRMIPEMTWVAPIVCPEGYALTVARTDEVRPDRPHPRGRRTNWYGCRDASGSVLPTDEPHFRVAQSAWAMTFLALVWPVFMAVRRLLDRR